MIVKPKVLFLYTEIAEYLISACSSLSMQADVFIIRWPVNEEAPFAINIPEEIKIIERNQLSSQQLIEVVRTIKPDAVFCSGWVDKGYLKVVKELYGSVPTVVSMDNHWKGSLKQLIACLGAQYSFLKYFDYAWVPGDKQVNYAKNLGFKQNQIFTGFYIANLKRFNDCYEQFKVSKKANYPKQFLYLGRYVERKGIFDLWNAFENYRAAGGKWNLCCAGTGDQWENRIQSEGIEHIGFVQPNKIPKLIESSGAYILPSHIEPWGVSVQEMAAAGLPLLLSEEVGALDAFLSEGKNGFSFAQKSPEEIVKVMHLIEGMSDEQLLDMGEISHQKGNEINTQNWVSTILKIVQD